jgi:TatD DNase family protein
MAARLPEMQVAVGLHPHEADRWDDDYGAALARLAASRKVAALGETGLDFYRDWSPREDQDRCFRGQLALARELDLPVVFHVRDAEDAFLRVIDEEGAPPRAVVHAFSSHKDFAAACVQRGFWLGVGGQITYRKGLAGALRAAAPIERILLETDCPWLTPKPHRGQRNEPALLVQVRAALAEVYELSEEQVDTLTDYAFERFLGEA